MDAYSIRVSFVFERIWNFFRHDDIGDSLPIDEFTIIPQSLKQTRIVKHDVHYYTN
jgi:hypothetical protein